MDIIHAAMLAEVWQPLLLSDRQAVQAVQTPHSCTP